MRKGLFGNRHGFFLREHKKMLAGREDKESGNRKAARFFKNVGRISGRGKGMVLACACDGAANGMKIEKSVG